MNYFNLNKGVEETLPLIFLDPFPKSSTLQLAYTTYLVSEGNPGNPVGARLRR